MSFYSKYTKKRLQYIDLVRIIAILLVIFHHCRFHFIDAGLFRVDQVWPIGFLKMSTGDIGVSLFIFISGLGLTLSLKNKKISVSNFYAKRFSKIYPTFWLIYFIIFGLLYYFHYVGNPIMKRQLLFSLTGLDTYFLSFFNFPSYNLYDWFIGFIIIIYLIYPFLYFIYQKSQLALFITSISLIPISVLFNAENINLRFLPLRLLEFSLGMLYVKIAVENKRSSHLAIIMGSTILLIAFTIFRFPAQFSTYVILFRWISFDLVVLEICYFFVSLLNTRITTKIISYFASITYAMFLLQHQIIFWSSKSSNTVYKFVSQSINYSLPLFSLYLVTLIIVFAAIYTELEKKVFLIITKFGKRVQSFLITYTS